MFQCSACGCLENTSLTTAYWTKHRLDDQPEVLASYREVLGLKDGEELGSYCSVCSPFWFTEDGSYGVGPRPVGYEKTSRKYRDSDGLWHNKFDRIFLPKGLFHTNGDGNLAHIETLDTAVDQYRLELEDTEPRRWPGVECRLPRPSETAQANRWRRMMKVRLDQGSPRNLETLNHVISYAFSAPAPSRRGETMSVVAAAVALGGLAGGTGTPSMRRRAEPAPPTPEEIARAKERGAAKIAAAEAKRERRAAKRSGK